MPKKIGAGNKPQEFDAKDGEYEGEGSGSTGNGEGGDGSRGNSGGNYDGRFGPQNATRNEQKRLKEIGIYDEEAAIPQEILTFCEELSEDEIKKSSGWLSGLGTQDDVLKVLIHLRGFDKKPTVVSSSEIEEMISNGCLGYTRGMKVEFGAEQYKSGEMYIGRGTYGSGVYVSCFSSVDSRTLAHDTAVRYATDRATGKIGSVISGAIKKDAKIITKGELDKIRAELSPSWSEKQKMLFYNNGKLAVALGYDIIDCENDLYYIVLNRAKTVVEG